MFATFTAKVFGGTTGAAEPGAFTKGDATPSEDGSTSVGETGGQEGDALSTGGSSDGGEYHPLEDGANGAREERAACKPQAACVETPAQEAAQTVPSRGSSGGRCCDDRAVKQRSRGASPNNKVSEDATREDGR